MLHFGSVEAIQEEYIVPLTAVARSIELTGSVGRFFDRELLHQRTGVSVPSADARQIYDQLRSRSESRGRDVTARATPA